DQQEIPYGYTLSLHDALPIYWLRPPMIQFFGCTRVLVEGVTIRDAPFWVIHPVFCRDVIVRGVTVDSRNANNDGVDPDSSSHVLDRKSTRLNSSHVKISNAVF